MAIPIPVKENFPSAFVAWRLYEPDDSRITGLAINSDETNHFWSVNYSHLGKRFPEPDTSRISEVRRILQSKSPVNAVLKRVCVVTIPTGESKWQAQYKITQQLTAVGEVQAVISSQNIVETVVKDSQTGINISVKLADPSNQETGVEVKEFTEATGLFRDCTIKDKTQATKLLKSKGREELTKPSSGQFTSLKHKNKFFAMLRIASKNIITKVTKIAEKKEHIRQNIEADRSKIYGKGFNMYHTCPPPSDVNVSADLKYFDKLDLNTVVAMGILYDDPRKYIATDHLANHKLRADIWSKGVLCKNGIPVFSQEDGKAVFPHMMKKTGLSDSEISSIKITPQAITKSLYVSVQ